MTFDFDSRPSASPLVEVIWRTRIERDADSFISVAVTQWEMVITKQYGRATCTIRGPETKASPAPIPQDAEFFGITFRLGTFMPRLPIGNLVNGGVHLPGATGQFFWLQGSTWQLPTFDNADTFVERLVRQGQLIYEPVVDDVLQGRFCDLSLHSMQRRFLRATGLTHGTVSQIQRARYAMGLLQQGICIHDTVAQAGYADQPHLTRSLKRFIGQTPAQLMTISATR